MVASVREGFDGLAHHRLGTFGQHIESGGNCFIAVIIQQATQPFFPEIQRIQLAIEIPEIGLWHAAICRKNSQNILIHPTRADQLDGRKTHPFLKAFGRACIEAAGHIATDIEPMPDRGQPAK